MRLRLGDLVPDFEADTTQGRIRFHDVVRSNNPNVFSQSRFRVTGRTWIGQSGPWIVTGVL